MPGPLDFSEPDPQQPPTAEPNPLAALLPPPATPIGSMGIPLPAAPPPITYPRQVSQDPRQQLMAIAALGAMLGAGSRSGIGAGIGQGTLQGQQALQQIENQHWQIRQAQQQQIAQQQQKALAESDARQRQLQSALLTITQRVKDIPDKATYDTEIEGYASALQGAGYRLDANWLRQAVPYVAPSAEKRATSAINAFLKNPTNAELIKQHPDQLAKVVLTFDVDGDGVPEQVPLTRVAQIAKQPFAADASGQLITYAKGNTFDDKANADGIFQTLLAKAKAEGKNVEDPAVRLPLQEQAIKMATGDKAKAVDPEIADLNKQILGLRVDTLQNNLANNKQKNSAPDIQPGSKEYKIADDLASGRITMQQFRSLYSYSRDVGAKTAIYLKASEINPNFNPAQFEMGYKFASNPKTQNQMASINNVLSGVGDLLKASDAAKRAGATILNSAVLRGGIALGGKRYSNFNTARIAFADELSGALGYGSATDMSREMGFNMTDPNLSPENFRSALEDVVVPFVNRKKASLLGPMGIYGVPDMNPAAVSPAAPQTTTGGTNIGRFNVVIR